MLEPFNAVNLKREPGLVESYVELRNRHTRMLLTTPVQLTQTRAWLASTSALVHGLVAEGVLQGVCILYPERDNEVAIFSRRPGSGVGIRLLALVDELAAEAEVEAIWAWVRADNERALRVFVRAGYKQDKQEVREFAGESVPGIRYHKRSLT